LSPSSAPETRAAARGRGARPSCHEARQARHIAVPALAPPAPATPPALGDRSRAQPRLPLAGSRSTTRISSRCSSLGSALAPPCGLGVVVTAGRLFGAAHQSSAELSEQRLDEPQPTLTHRNPA